MATLKGVLTRICDIIESELGLSEGQVHLWKQKVTLPPTSGLWVSVGVVTLTPYGTSTRLDSAGNQVQSVNTQALISIDAQSQDESVIDLYGPDRIQAALQSFASQNMQTLNSFKIARKPESVVDLSELEGADIPYRFVITQAVLYERTIVKAAPYWDSFPKPNLVTEP